MNDRHDFRRLHTADARHSGIITCARDPDVVAIAGRIHTAIGVLMTLAGQLIKIHERVAKTAKRTVCEMVLGRTWMPDSVAVRLGFARSVKVSDCVPTVRRVAVK